MTYVQYLHWIYNIYTEFNEFRMLNDQIINELSANSPIEQTMVIVYNYNENNGRQSLTS